MSFRSAAQLCRRHAQLLVGFLVQAAAGAKSRAVQRCRYRVALGNLLAKALDPSRLLIFAGRNAKATAKNSLHMKRTQAESLPQLLQLDCLIFVPIKIIASRGQCAKLRMFLCWSAALAGAISARSAISLVG